MPAAVFLCFIVFYSFSANALKCSVSHDIQRDIEQSDIAFKGQLISQEPEKDFVDNKNILQDELSQQKSYWQTFKNWLTPPIVNTSVVGGSEYLKTKSTFKVLWPIKGLLSPSSRETPSNVTLMTPEHVPSGELYIFAYQSSQMNTYIATNDGCGRGFQSAEKGKAPVLELLQEQEEEFDKRIAGSDWIDARNAVLEKGDMLEKRLDYPAMQLLFEKSISTIVTPLETLLPLQASVCEPYGKIYEETKSQPLSRWRDLAPYLDQIWHGCKPSIQCH